VVLEHLEFPEILELTLLESPEFLERLLKMGIIDKPSVEEWHTTQHQNLALR
jgi:hypothetical protein